MRIRPVYTMAAWGLISSTEAFVPAAIELIRPRPSIRAANMPLARGPIVRNFRPGRTSQSIANEGGIIAASPDGSSLSFKTNPETIASASMTDTNSTSPSPSYPNQYIARLKDAAVSLLSGNSGNWTDQQQTVTLTDEPQNGARDPGRLVPSGGINVAEHFEKWKAEKIANQTIAAAITSEITNLSAMTVALSWSEESLEGDNLADTVGKVGNGTLIVASVLPISLMGAAGISVLAKRFIHRNQDAMSANRPASFFSEPLNADSDVSSVQGQDDSDDGLTSQFEVGNDAAMWAHQADFSAF